jgi:hypothetical protein
MPRQEYTDDEVVLCTYIALYGRSLLIEKKIASYGKRSEASVKMKVQNIAAMLDEEGIERSQEVTALTGVTTGQDGRRTNWDVVSKLVGTSKDEHKQKCKEIIASS